MTTIMQLLENAIDILGSDCPNINEASDRVKDAMFYLTQGRHCDDDLTSKTVLVNLDPLTFGEFKACVFAQLENAEEVGTFIDDTECYVDDDPKRYVYYWASLPKYGSEYIEYDTGNQEAFRWIIHIGNRRVFGRTFGEVCDNFHTCHK